LNHRVHRVHREQQGKIFVLPLTHWLNGEAVESPYSTGLFDDFKTLTAGFRIITCPRWGGRSLLRVDRSPTGSGKSRRLMANSPWLMLIGPRWGPRNWNRMDREKNEIVIPPFFCLLSPRRSRGRRPAFVRVCGRLKKYPSGPGNRQPQVLFFQRNAGIRLGVRPK